MSKLGGAAGPQVKDRRSRSTRSLEAAKQDDRNLTKACPDQRRSTIAASRTQRRRPVISDARVAAISKQLPVTLRNHHDIRSLDLLTLRCINPVRPRHSLWYTLSNEPSPAGWRIQRRGRRRTSACIGAVTGRRIRLVCSSSSTFGLSLALKAAGRLAQSRQLWFDPCTGGEPPPCC